MDNISFNISITFFSFFLIGNSSLEENKKRIPKEHTKRTKLENVAVSGLIEPVHGCFSGNCKPPFISSSTGRI
jgi:hypothetical protein